MSGLQQFFDGRRAGKAPARSSFMHTCNHLSRYIKKKGSLRDFNLEIDGKIESLESIMKSGSSHAASASSTVNLLTQMDKPSMDSFLCPARPHSSTNLLEDTSMKDIISKDATKIEPKTAQLTIFYGGRVLVFDSCPADKTNELVKFASEDSPHISGGIVSNILHHNPSPRAVAGTTPCSRDGLPPAPSFQTAGCVSSDIVGHQMAGGISSNTSKDIENTGSHVDGLSSGTEARTSLRPEVNSSDLPIARRSSVHRFLAKRKERAAARGPYQIQEHAPSS